jgi:hypothetical protein
MVFVSSDSLSCEVPCLILQSVVYRDVTRQAKGLYRLKYVGALKSGLAYLSRCNSGWFCHSSVRITDGKANSPVSWGSLPSYLTIEGVVTEYKVGLCMNLSFDRKVMLVVRVIYTYYSHLYFPHKHYPRLYVLSTILNESNTTLPNILLVKFLYWKHF